MAIVLLAHTAKLTADGESVITSPINTVGANFIIIAGSVSDSITGSVFPTDSLGNLWTPLTKYSGFGGFSSIQFWYCASPMVGPAHTFELFPGFSAGPSIAVQVFSGVKSVSPFDLQNGAAASSPGAILPTADDELVVTAISIQNGIPVSASGFTNTDIVAGSGVNYGIGMAYQVQGAATSVNPTWTNSGGTIQATNIAAFKVSSVVPPSTLPPGLSLDPTTGEITGTPTQAGTYPISVTVTDSAGGMVTISCTITVSPAETCGPRIGPKLYFWEPSYLERPEDIAERATDYEDAGLVGVKFFQGFTLQADTNGVDKMIALQGDAAEVLQTYTINHNGEVILPYTFDPAKFSSLIRVIGLDSVPWRFFGIRYIWEPAPELVTYYETQGTTHDLPGYQFLKDGYIALMSTADVNLAINVDGTMFNYTIPSSGGVFKKFYILFGINPTTGQTLKGKLYTYILSSTAGFRLFQKDCEIRTHSWAGGDYIVRQPFGDTSRIYGARI